MALRAHSVWLELQPCARRGRPLPRRRAVRGYTRATHHRTSTPAGKVSGARWLYGLTAFGSNFNLVPGVAAPYLGAARSAGTPGQPTIEPALRPERSAELDGSTGSQRLARTSTLCQAWPPLTSAPRGPRVHQGNPPSNQHSGRKGQR